MSAPSSYLRFLPPVVYETDPKLPQFSVSAALRVFEKILSGIDDGIDLIDDGHTHEAIAQRIARLDQLFDPKKIEKESLPWLAQWLQLKLRDRWDEYQRRKIIGEIATIYHKRGLKAGLDQFLDLYTLNDAKSRPRIVVDDSTKLWFANPHPSRYAQLSGLISQLPLLQPRCIALAPDRTLVIGDKGPGENWPGPIDAPGIYVLAPVAQPNDPPVTIPTLIPPTFNNGDPQPIAVAVDNQSPWNAYVLIDWPGLGNQVLHRVSSPAFAGSTPIPFTPTPNRAEAMVYDPWIDQKGALIILDNDPKKPVLSIVPTAGGNAYTFPLSTVVDGMSLTILADQSLIIGSGGPSGTSPAYLTQITRPQPGFNNINSWTETQLLQGLLDNPLTSPAAVVQEDATHLLVVDAGLKSRYPDVIDPFLRDIVQDSAVYRVNLQAPSVSRASETKQLVWPSGAVLDRGTLFITDAGEPEIINNPSDPDHGWRARPYEFGVVVHFKDNMTTIQERRDVIMDVTAVLERERAIHARYSIVSAI